MNKLRRSAYPHMMIMVPHRRRRTKLNNPNHRRFPQNPHLIQTMTLKLPLRTPIALSTQMAPLRRYHLLPRRRSHQLLRRRAQVGIMLTTASQVKVSIPRRPGQPLSSHPSCNSTATSRASLMTTVTSHPRPPSTGLLRMMSLRTPRSVPYSLHHSRMNLRLYVRPRVRVVKGPSHCFRTCSVVTRTRQPPPQTLASTAA